MYSSSSRRRLANWRLLNLRLMAWIEQKICTRHAKVLFHSVWGHVSGPKRAAVGIQEWSNDSYDKFRHIELEEIETFASECASASESLMKTAIPLFHGATAIVVDDGDGLTKRHEKPEGRIPLLADFVAKVFLG
jgi:hypothetical protein